MRTAVMARRARAARKVSHAEHIVEAGPLDNLAREANKEHALVLDDLARAANQAHALFCEAFSHGLDYARTCGDMLLAAKSSIAHGRWLPWLRTHCPDISERTCRGYMQVASRWPEIEAARKRQCVADLTFGGALKLLASPRPESPPEPSEPEPTPDETELKAAPAVLDGPLEFVAPPSDGMLRARRAIRCLEEISDDDTEREQAFRHVRAWLDERLKRGE